jgi:hypothetical protein
MCVKNYEWVLGHFLLQKISDFCRLIDCPEATSYVDRIFFMTITSFSANYEERKKKETIVSRKQVRNY